MKELLGHYTNQQLLFMYQEKIRLSELLEDVDLTWRKEQLEADSDMIFEELRTRGFFFDESNLGLLNAFQDVVRK